jgi:hypothetical protein
MLKRKDWDAARVGIAMRPNRSEMALEPVMEKGEVIAILLPARLPARHLHACHPPQAGHGCSHDGRTTSPNQL